MASQQQMLLLVDNYTLAMQVGNRYKFGVLMDSVHVVVVFGELYIVYFNLLPA